jgi:hypothetical protein
MKNADIELRISQLTGIEERQRVKHAVFESWLRDRRRLEALNRADLEATRIERRRCLAFCEQFPDNLMAKHIAKLIRGDE